MNWENERAFDRALGVDTALVDRSWDSRRSHPCQPTPLKALEAVAERLPAGTHIVDCGCGTGRAVFALAQAGYTVTGVELDGRRYAQAEENLRRCMRKAPETAARVRLVHASAQDYMPDGDVTAYYFFNPFPAQVLRGVLRRIAETGREIRLICYYPDDEWLELLLEEGWERERCIDLRPILGNDERERVEIFCKKISESC